MMKQNMLFVIVLAIIALCSSLARAAEVTLLLDDVARSVVFLHVPSKSASSSQDRIEIGTGFLVKLDAELFLVTAEHVAKKMDDQASVTLSGEGDSAHVYSIPYILGASVTPQWITHKRADVAVLRVQPAEPLHALLRGRALPHDIFVTVLEAPPRSRPLTIVGFPLGLGVPTGHGKISAISQEAKASKSGHMRLAQ
jgi:hypothetical protein